MLASACIPAAAALAGPGELDGAFGTNGIVRVAEPPLGNDNAAGAAALADDSVLVGRWNDGATQDFSVLRVGPYGIPDPTFAGNGGASADIQGFDGRTLAVLEQSDGKLLAGGTLIVDYGAVYQIQSELLALARFLADGRLDTTLGTDGIARVALHTDDWITSARANAVAQQVDGKLVAAGTVGYMSPWGYGDFWGHDMLLVRFDASGILDPSYGRDGRVVLDLTDEFPGSEIRGLVDQPDGKLVGAGFIGAALAVVRLTADGTLDPSFDGDGIVTLPVAAAGALAAADAVAVQPDGKIVITGTTRTGCDLETIVCYEPIDALVARLDSDGRLDASFGDGGGATFHVSGRYTAMARGGLVIEPSGGVLVAGDAGARGGVVWSGIAAPAPGAQYGFVVRFTPAGSIDTAFGNDGVTLLDVGHGRFPSSAGMQGITRLADGDIVAAMTAAATSGATRIVLARIEPTGIGNPGIVGLVDPDVTVDEGREAVLARLSTPSCVSSSSSMRASKSGPMACPRTGGVTQEPVRLRAGPALRDRWPPLRRLHARPTVVAHSGGTKGVSDMLYLDDLAVGQRYRTATVEVTAEAIKAFAAAFDPQPFHLDEAAARESVFGRLVASGWHTGALSMRLLVEGEMRIAGGLIGLGGELSWPRAVYPGDVLHVESEVLDIRESRSKPDRGVVTVRNSTVNQRGEVVQLAVVKMLVPRREAA